MKKILTVCALSMAGMLILAGHAHANVGLPMVFLGLPFLVLAFIPVALIEMAVYRRDLDLPLKRAGWGSFWANLVTTLIGYPISWALHCLLGMAVGIPVAFLAHHFSAPDWVMILFFPFYASWMMPGVPGWMLYLAGLFCLVPAFFVSVYFERRLLKRMFADRDAQKVRTAVWRANKITYLLLAAVLAGLTAFHGLAKVHAFDIFRDQSALHTAFKAEPQGALILSADEDFYRLDLKTRRIEKVIRDFGAIERVHFSEAAMTASDVWFVNRESGVSRPMELYRYGLGDGKLKKIAGWRSILDLAAAGPDVYVFAGERYGHAGEIMPEDGVYRVRRDGSVEKIAEGGAVSVREYNFLSPDGSKIAYLKNGDARPLKIIYDDPYYVTAELWVYDIAEKASRKIADVAGMALYNYLGCIHVSWDPSGDKVYFSNIADEGGLDGLMRALRVDELRASHGIRGGMYRSEQMSALMDIIETRLERRIEQYDLKTGTRSMFCRGHHIVTWHPDGREVIIAKDDELKGLELINTATGAVWPFAFDHLTEYARFACDWSADGAFIAYLGDSGHVLDRHHYRDRGFMGGGPRWVWIKEVATGRERKFAMKPVRAADALRFVPPPCTTPGTCPGLYRVF